MMNFKKALALMITSIMITVFAIPAKPVSAATYVVATDTSPIEWRNQATYICNNGELPSALKTALQNGGNTFRFAPGEYWIEGTTRSIMVGSNTTIIGTTPIVQPAAWDELMYPDSGTYAVFATRSQLLSTQESTAEQTGVIQTVSGAYNITFQDIQLKGHTVLKLNSAKNTQVNNVVIHNYRGTYPNGQWCNMGYGRATGSLWLYGNCDTVYIRNCNIQCSSHHGLTIHTGSSSYLTKNVYISDTRVLYAGCGQLRGQTDSERANAAARVPETGGYGYYDWSVGFDLCENQSIDNVQLTDCYALDAWKVGFYTEPESTGGNIKNLSLKRCRSDNGGQRALLVGSNPRVTKVKETEGCNFYFQGGYFEDCISVNGEKSGWLFGVERTGANPVTPGRLRMVNCGDRGSPKSLVMEMNGSQDIYCDGFWSMLPTQYAMWIYGSNNMNFTNMTVLTEVTSHPPFKLGYMLRQQITESRDPDNQDRTEVPGQDANDYDLLRIGTTNSSLTGSVHGYPSGNMVEIASGSTWNGSANPSTIGANLTRSSAPINPDDYVVPLGSGSNQNQSAPTGLVGVAPTTSANTDGKITGTTTLMEYKLSSAAEYISCSATETTGLVPGAYVVRYAAKPGYNASPNTTVVVESYSEPGGPIVLAYSSKHPDWMANGYGLGTSNTGDQMIQFDVTPLSNNIDAQIAYIDSSTVLSGTGFDYLAMQVRFNSAGYFDVRNGAAFAKTATVNYSQNTKYHVEIEADMDAESYSVYITPNGGNRTQIAADYGFRSSAPETNDVGEVFFISDLGDGLFKAENHTVAPAANQEQQPPTGLAGVAPTTAENNNGKITGTSALMEYKPVSGSEDSYETCSATETNGLASGIYDVRYAARTGYNASLPVQVTVPKQTRSAPTSLTGVSPTSIVESNGKITGTTTAMEYKVSTAPDTSYSGCMATETTGLAAATYVVRYAETAVYFASPTTEVTVPMYEEPNPPPSGVYYSYDADTWSSHGISLGSGNTGKRHVEFDATPAGNNIDGSISYADTSTTVSGFNGLAMMVRFNPGGYFDVRNGAVFEKAGTVNYAAEETYRVEIVADMDAHTYSVYVTPEGGARTQIASNYVFRSDAPATNDIGQLFVISEDANQLIKVENHKVSASYDSVKYPDCFSAGINLGSGNTGTVTVDYDVTPLVGSIDGSVSFADFSTNVTSFSGLAMMVRFNTAGYFDVRNGASFAKTATVNYAAGSRYHVQIVANMTAHTYNVYVRQYGGSNTQIASNYAFRSDAPHTDDVGQLFTISEPNSNMFKVDNLTITAQ